MLTPEARRRGGKSRARQARLGRAVRVVGPEDVPGGALPKTLDDCIAWSSWLAFASATGLLDPASCRECNRSLGTLKDSLNKADLLKRIKALEVKLRAYERERRV